jgi:hypothetical protein
VHQHLGLASRYPARDAAVAERRRQRHISAGERLADAHHVRGDPCVLGGEQCAARAAEAGRDLVEDQQHVVLVAQLAQSTDVGRRIEVHPAGALHDRLRDRRRQLACVRLEQRRRLRVPGGVHRGDVEAAGRPRREQLLPQRPGEQMVHPAHRVAHRHRPERVPVVPTAQRQQPLLLGTPARALELQRHLDGDLDADRAGVGEEDVLHALRRQLDEPTGQLDRGRMREAAEHHVRHLPELLLHGRVEPWMTVAVDRAPP